MSTKYVVIGASAAGIAAVHKLRQLEPDATIVCITQEKELPYNKCFLADYLSAEKNESELFLKPETFFKENTIELMLSTCVVDLIPETQTVFCDNGLKIKYDKLLLAMGSSVYRPPIEGLCGAPSIFDFHTLSDTNQLLKMVQKETVKNVVIIGAGLSGVECADSLRHYGVAITLVERDTHVLPHQITSEAAEFLQEKIQNYSVDLRLAVTVQKVCHDEKQLQGVELSDGSFVKADMVVCALGNRPNSWLAQQAGIMVKNGSILTDDFLKTSEKDIYAAGDVALVTDALSGAKIRSCSWPDALKQGRVAASNMAAIEQNYGGTVKSACSAFFGIKFNAAGDVKESKKSYNTVLRKSDEGFRLITTENGVVKGFLLLGAAHQLAELKRSLLTQQPCQVISHS